MKNPLLTLFLLISFFGFTQIPERQLLKGIIKVPKNAEVENINVYNLNTKKGTTTNSIGKFLIKVKEKDHLLITSVQFQEFEVEITNQIMEELDVVIHIHENVNQLNEVTVSSNLLIGNLDVDVKKIKTNDTYLNINTNKLVSGYDANITIESQIRAENKVIDNDYLDYPMDFIKILKMFVKKKYKMQSTEYLDEQLRNTFDNSFFTEYLDIREDKVNAFIYYITDNGLDKKILKKNNEMDLIEFLVRKAQVFNQNLNNSE